MLNIVTFFLKDIIIEKLCAKKKLFIEQFNKIVIIIPKYMFKLYI